MSLETAMPVRYGRFTQAVHWLTALLIVAAWGLGMALESFPREVRATPGMIHATLGAAVMTLAVVRVLWRLVSSDAMPGEPGAAGRARAAMHFGLVAMTLLLPLSGVLTQWGRGRNVNLLGGSVVIPPPFQVPGGRAWGEVHEVLAYLLVVMLAGHVLVSLWRHAIRHEDTLRRMLPGPRAA
jgi:cytochrome b561